MLSEDEKSRLEELAYVPEHLPNLMVSISKGEPYLLDGYLYIKGDSWLIVNGYPIGTQYSEERFLSVVKSLERTYKPNVLWAISPSMPKVLIEASRIYEKDVYLTLDLDGFSIPRNLVSYIEKKRRSVNIVLERSYTSAHEKLLKEFVDRKELGGLVRGLYLSLGSLISDSPSTTLISAYGGDDKLLGFYAIDSSSKKFLTYVLGCRDVSFTELRVSDLIFFEMVEYAKSIKKEYIHLGLAVNEGIRRFKEKWGGKVFLPYQFVEIRRKDSLLNSISSLTSKL